MQASEYIDKVKAERNQLRVDNAELVETLKSAMGCMCAFQHIANPDREAIQAEIDHVKDVLDKATTSESGAA